MVGITSIRLLAISCLGSGAFAYFVPSDMPDGLYTAQFNDDGDEVHQRFGNITRKVFGPHHVRDLDPWRLIPRRPDEVSCADPGLIMESADIQMAQLSLGASCNAAGDDYIGPWHGMTYAKSGNAVVFTCNMAHNSQGCSSHEINAALASIQTKCKNREGWYTHHDWAKSYGYVHGGNTVCGGLAVE